MPPIIVMILGILLDGREGWDADVGIVDGCGYFDWLEEDEGGVQNPKTAIYHRVLY